jgi:signal recognition particle GTPase
LGDAKRTIPATKMQDPILKITKVKRAGDMAQVVECLPSKHKTLSSNPLTIKKKKKSRMEYMIISHLFSKDTCVICS